VRLGSLIPRRAALSFLCAGWYDMGADFFLDELTT